MPWQQYVADVLLEIDPATGRFAYSEFGLTVPRQSGKSTFVLAKAVHRASAPSFFGKRQSIIYTAQTRKDARKKFEEDYAGVLEASPTFKRLVDPRWGNGNEHIRFPNGSRFGIEASTEKAGHGPVLDEAYIDEAFAQVDGRLEQAFRPAMITRRNKQLGWISTAGWSDGSPFLQAKRAKGIEAIESGSTSGLAYFEWSAGEDEDPESPDTWQGCMPALNHTITEEAIAHEFRSMDLADFRRAFLNQWVPKGGPTHEAIVDMDRWAGLAGIDPTIRPDPVALSVVASPDRKWASIGLAGLRADGHRQLQILQAGRGTDWVVDRLKSFSAEWKPVAIAVAPDDPAASLIPDIKAARLKLLPATTREYAQGCGMLVDGIAEGTVHHSAQRQVDISLAAANKKRTGESWTFSAPADGTDISPLKAITLALYALTAKKKPQRETGSRRAVVF